MERNDRVSEIRRDKDREIEREREGKIEEREGRERRKEMIGIAR